MEGLGRLGPEVGTTAISKALAVALRVDALSDAGITHLEEEGEGKYRLVCERAPRDAWKVMHRLQGVGLQATAEPELGVARIELNYLRPEEETADYEELGLRPRRLDLGDDEPAPASGSRSEAARETRGRGPNRYDDEKRERPPEKD